MVAVGKNFLRDRAVGPDVKSGTRSVLRKLYFVSCVRQVLFDIVERGREA